MALLLLSSGQFGFIRKACLSRRPQHRFDFVLFIYFQVFITSYFWFCQKLKEKKNLDSWFDLIFLKFSISWIFHFIIHNSCHCSWNNNFLPIFECWYFKFFLYLSCGKMTLSFLHLWVNLRWRHWYFWCIWCMVGDPIKSFLALLYSQGYFGDDITINCTYVSDKTDMVVWYRNSRSGVRKPIVIKTETGNQVDTTENSLAAWSSLHDRWKWFLPSSS